MSKQAFGTLIVLGILVVSATTISAAPQAVNLALDAVGAGSAEEIRSRLFTDRVARHTQPFRAAAVAALPGYIREQRITEGSLLRRVERVIAPVLELHSRQDCIELILFREYKPVGMLWRESVLVLSSGLAAALEDAELLGIVAHEMGHSYFMDELVAARNQSDVRAMRVVELKCDAVAMLSLKLLGHQPGDHLRGLKKLERLLERMGLTSRRDESHPSIVERAQFAERFSKLLTTPNV